MAGGLCSRAAVLASLGTTMTTLYRIAHLMSAAMALAVLSPASAHAQANCEWYAKTALKQQQDNEQLKCGFKGDAWSTDYKAHVAWCQSVAPDAWKDQAKKRDQDLAACPKK